MNTKFRLIVAALIFSIPLFANAINGLEINDPWVRSAPANAPALALFMKIDNNTSEEVRLISAHTNGYKRIELHRTIDVDGLMKMVKQEFMPIEANNSLHLKPGSWHIMLIGPDAVPTEGGMVMVKLNFNNGQSQTVHARVKKGKMMMKNHDMHDMKH